MSLLDLNSTSFTKMVDAWYNFIAFGGPLIVVIIFLVVEPRTSLTEKIVLPFVVYGIAALTGYLLLTKLRLSGFIWGFDISPYTVGLFGPVVFCLSYALLRRRIRHSKSPGEYIIIAAIIQAAAIIIAAIIVNG